MAANAAVGWSTPVIPEFEKIEALMVASSVLSRRFSASRSAPPPG
jgi:hypothetical protein